MKNLFFTLIFAAFFLGSSLSQASEYTDLERFLEGPLGRVFFKTPEGGLLAEKLAGARLEGTAWQQAVIAALRRPEMNDIAGELATRTEVLHDRFQESLYRTKPNDLNDTAIARLQNLIHTDFALTQAADSNQAITFVKPLPEMNNSYNAKLRTFMMVESGHGDVKIANSAKNLAGIDLSDVRTRLSFKESRMDFADLSRSHLQDANFMRAKLTGSDFRNAILENVDLRGADLSGVDFSGARFVKCDLRDADLSGANLKGVDLDQLDLRGATYDTETLVDSTAAGMLRRTGWTREIIQAPGSFQPIQSTGRLINPWFGKYRLSTREKLTRALGL
jgi:uncharacterized protein YjbI with pentapeptide repeats